MELAEASELPPERLLAPTEVRADGVPPELVGWRCGWPPSTAPRPPGRSRSCCRRAGARARSCGPRRRRAPDGAAAQRAPARAARRPAAGRGRATSPPCGGWRRAGSSPSRRGRAGARRSTVAGADADVALTAEQAAAVAAVEEGGAWLLHGVTGSGKTEVYLRAAAAALERGEGVIVLVPEIALTPQTVGRFQARFGDTVALLHSALSEGERYDEWRRLRSGEARIAVGPRSAVFAPVRDLGLVVLDEEHDPSYKHEGDPRYDAAGRVRPRRVALDTGAQLRPPGRLLAGSATPRPGELARGCRTCGSPRASAAARCRPCACSTCAAPATRCIPRPGGRWRGAQGDPPAQPPRVVELPHLPELREGLGVPELRRRRSCCTAPRPAVACHHCGHRERVPGALRRLRLARGGPPRRGHGAPGGRARRGARRARLPPRRGHGRRQGRRARAARALRRRARRAAASARRWWPRATTSPT